MQVSPSQEISAQEKLRRMRRGERVIADDSILDAISDIDPDGARDIRSVRNLDGVGTRDTLIAWIHDSAAPAIVRRDANGFAYARMA